jgi:hypothetical protein
MKKIIVLLAVALAIPTTAALAKGTPTRGKSAPKVMYVLKGTLWNYQAATATQDGQITIHVLHSNYHGRALKGNDLTFSTTMKTRVTFKKGAVKISDGAKGVLKFRAPLRVPGGNSTLATTLPTLAKALHIIDQARH